MGKQRKQREDANMPINQDAVGSKGTPRTWAWNSRDALLYALGVGCGMEDPVGSEAAAVMDEVALEVPASY